MTAPPRDYHALLSELAALPVDRALDALVRERSMPEAIDRLAEEAERAVIRDLSGALSWTEALVRLSDAAGQRRARVRRSRAQALSYANRFPEAEAVLADGIRLADEQGDSKEAAQCRLMSLHALARQGKLEEAIRMGMAARDAFVRAGEAFHVARADINLGVTLRMQDRPADAIARFDLAAAHVEAIPMIMAQLQSNRAEALLDLHRFGEAHVAFESALRAFELAGATRGAAIVEGNLADLCGRQGRLDEALDHFERARRRLSEADAPGDQARLEVERAEALLQLGLAEEAERAFRAAVPVLRERGMAFEAARACAGVGRALLARQRFAEACRELEAAISEFNAIGHTTGVNRVLLLLSRALLGAGRTVDARRTLAELAARDDLKPVERAEVSGFSALATAKLGDFAAAKGLMRSAILEAERIGLPVLLAELFQHESWIHEHAGDGGAALTALQSAMDMVERVRSGLRGEKYRAVFSGAFAGAYEEYVRLWLDRGGDPLRALEVMERGRARALLDELGAGPLLSVMAASDSDDVRLLRRRSELHAMIGAAHAAMDAAPGRGGGGESPQALEAKLADVELRLAATRRFAGDFARPPGGGRIVSQIPTDCALIEYFWERDDISACVIRQGSVRVLRGLCDRDQVRASLGALRLQVSMAASRGLSAGMSKGAARADAELSRLGGLLIEPAWSLVRGCGQLAVIADDVLASAPFHAMRVEGETMLDLADVVTAPSAAVMCSLSERRTGNGPRVVIGVGDENAPHAEAECRAVAESFGATRVLLGPEATVQRVKEAMSGASGVHIAAHARFVAHSPMQSAIRLADGWLTARDLYGVELQGGVVVLSACDSGRTGTSHGRELLGLVRAFLSAGAGSLILSQWLLHDESAVHMLTDAYSLLYQDPSMRERPASALRAAQRRARDRVPHVAAWGGLCTVGSWNRGDS